LDSKSQALAEADRLRTAIRADQFGRAGAERSEEEGGWPTVGQIAELYLRKHVAIIPETGAVRRAGGRALMELHIRLLREARVPDGRGGSITLNMKRLDDLTWPT
jgi:hypothetical protein